MHHVKYEKIHPLHRKSISYALDGYHNDFYNVHHQYQVMI
jgi:hypothetical protein